MTTRKPLQLKRGKLARIQALGLAYGEPAIAVDDPTKPVLLVGDQAGNPRDISGTDGEDGQGVPLGGTKGQSLKKLSDLDFDTGWEDDGGGVATYDYASLPATAAEGTVAYVTDAIGWVGEVYKCISGQQSTSWRVSPPHSVAGCDLFRMSWDGCFRYASGAQTLTNTAYYTSSTLNSVAWGFRRCSISESALGVGPDFGALGVVTEDTTTNSHPICYENSNWSSVGGSTYILSLVWKPGTRRRVRISLGSEAFVGNESISFNSITGEVALSNALGGGVISLQNGCYRLWIKATSRQSIQSLPLWVWPLDDNGSPFYLGNGGISFYAGFLDIKIGTSLTYWIGPSAAAQKSQDVHLAGDKTVTWNSSERNDVVVAWGRPGTLAVRRGGKWVDVTHGYDLYPWS